MKLIVECSQKLVRLGERLWGKEQELDKEMQEHQKLCDEIMAIQGIEPIEAEMEQIIHCPKGYQFTDENGNVINATKIVLEKKKKEYPKTYKECYRIMDIDTGFLLTSYDIDFWKGHLLTSLQKLLICRDAYWKVYGEENGLGKPWEPNWEENSEKSIITKFRNVVAKFNTKEQYTFAFPTKEMRDAFYENFKELIESCKELL